MNDTDTEGNNQILVYSNPTTNELNISYSGVLDEKLVIVLTVIGGKTLISKKVYAMDGKL